VYEQRAKEKTGKAGFGKNLKIIQRGICQDC
jgi:hypothetical protein